MLYMFRTPFASIIRSTITVTAATGVCHELGWNKSCIGVQGRLRTLLFHGQIGTGQVRVLTHAPDQSHFGHGILVVQCTTDLEHLYRIYSIPTYDNHQWLLLQFIVLLMMDAKGFRNM